MRSRAPLPVLYLKGIEEEFYSATMWSRENLGWYRRCDEVYGNGPTPDWWPDGKFFMNFTEDLKALQSGTHFENLRDLLVALHRYVRAVKLVVYHAECEHKKTAEKAIENLGVRIEFPSGDLYFEGDMELPMVPRVSLVGCGETRITFLKGRLKFTGYGEPLNRVISMSGLTFQADWHIACIVDFNSFNGGVVGEHTLCISDCKWLNPPDNTSEDCVFAKIWGRQCKFEISGECREQKVNSMITYVHIPNAAATTKAVQSTNSTYEEQCATTDLRQSNRPGRGRNARRFAPYCMGKAKGNKAY